MVSLEKLERKDCPAPQGCGVCLARMGRRELPAPLDPLVLWVREESKEPPVLPASRDCPDHQVPLGRAANPETRVFLEKLVPPVLLVPEVNVDSPVNAALPVPKGCRVPVGSPERPALTDPRVQPVQPAPTVPRVPQGCRECPVREEQLASLAPRVTGEMLVRKDLRELQARMAHVV